MDNTPQTDVTDLLSRTRIKLMSRQGTVVEVDTTGVAFIPPTGETIGYTVEDRIQVTLDCDGYVIPTATVAPTDEAARLRYKLAVALAERDAAVEALRTCVSAMTGQLPSLTEAVRRARVVLDTVRTDQTPWIDAEKEKAYNERIKLCGLVDVELAGVGYQFESMAPHAVGEPEPGGASSREFDSAEANVIEHMQREVRSRDGKIRSMYIS